MLPSHVGHIVLGFILFWVFLGWRMMQELSDPRAPRPTDTGAPGFITGQAAALLGALALAGLVGIEIGRLLGLVAAASLSLNVRIVPVAACAIALLAEALWIHAAEPLHEEHEFLSRLRFGAGRDLLLRHVLPFFIALSLIASLQAENALRSLVLGAALGWGAMVAAWGIPVPAALGTVLRKGLAVFALLGALFLVHHAFRLYIGSI